MHQRPAAISWVTDLGRDIGSLEWFRGLATLCTLIAAALLLWPSPPGEYDASAQTRSTVAVSEVEKLRLPPLASASSAHPQPPIASAFVVPLYGFPPRSRIELTTALLPTGDLKGTLQRAGIGSSAADAAAKLMAGELQLAKLEPGSQMTVTLGPRSAPDLPRRLEAITLRPSLGLELKIARQGERLYLARRSIAVDTTPIRLRGIVEQNLEQSAVSAGVPSAAIRQYAMAVSERVRTAGGIRAGDEFDLVIAQQRAADGQARTGEVLYAGLRRGTRPLAELVRWGPYGRFHGSTDMAQIGSAVPGLSQPVQGRVTSRFGLRRHPILGYTRMHYGIDLSAAWGTPIRAVSSGVVEQAGWHGGHGNYVRLAHGNAISTGYGHMSRIAVPQGTRVRSGQIIGYVGSTGLSTGPHLHYELYRGGRRVDPKELLAWDLPVDLDSRAAFRARLASLRAVRPRNPLAHLGRDGKGPGSTLGSNHRPPRSS